MTKLNPRKNWTAFWIIGVTQQSVAINTCRLQQKYWPRYQSARAQVYNIKGMQAINRGSRSYTSAHVLLNLLNKLGKSDEMPGLLSILQLFHIKFNKFNNTGAQMLDSIYQMT